MVKPWQLKKSPKLYRSGVVRMVPTAFGKGDAKKCPDGPLEDRPKVVARTICAIPLRWKAKISVSEMVPCIVRVGIEDGPITSGKFETLGPTRTPTQQLKLPSPSAGHNAPPHLSGLAVVGVAKSASHAEIVCNFVRRIAVDAVGFGVGLVLNSMPWKKEPRSPVEPRKDRCSSRMYTPPRLQIKGPTALNKRNSWKCERRSPRWSGSARNCRALHPD